MLQLRVSNRYLAELNWKVWATSSPTANQSLMSLPPLSTAVISTASVAALTAGAPPPTEQGLVWCDVRATRVFEWRATVAG